MGDEKNDHFTSKVLQFSLGGVKRSNHWNFKEMRLGDTLHIAKNTAKVCSFKIKDYSLHSCEAGIHVDFCKKFKNLRCKVWKDSDKSIKLKLHNVSSRDVTIPSQQFVVTLEKINQS